MNRTEDQSKTPRRPSGKNAARTATTKKPTAKNQKKKGPDPRIIPGAVE